MKFPTAVDPIGCGCNECITGEYVPFDKAKSDVLAALLHGDIKNNTGLTTYREFIDALEYNTYCNTQTHNDLIGLAYTLRKTALK